MNNAAILALLFSSAGLPTVAWAQAKVNAPSGEFLPSATGTIRDNLPKPPLEPARSIIYPKPGEVIISTRRICGDGDVENFAAGRPSFDIMHKDDKELGLTTGVLVRNANAFVWFPAAAGPIANGSATLKELPSLATGNKESLTVSGVAAMQALSAMKGYRMPGAAAPVKGEVFFSAMMCKTTQLNPATAPGGVTVKFPAKIQVGSLVAGSVRGTVESAVDAAMATGNLTTLDSFAISSDEKSISVAFGPGGKSSAAGDALVTLGKSIFSLPYPSCGSTCTLPQYLSAMAAQPDAKRVGDLFNALQKAQTCGQVPGVSLPPSGAYWWEPIPLQLTCQQLDAGGSFASLGGGLLNPTAVPTVAEFQTLKKGMAALLVKAGLLQQVQNALEKGFAKEGQRHSCIPDMGPFVDKVMLSLSVGATLKTKQNVTFKAAHPEGSFVLKDSKQYLSVPAGNRKTLMGSGGDDLPLFELEQGKGPSLDGASRLNQGSIMLEMNIRALGCCGQEPCFC